MPENQRLLALLIDGDQAYADLVQEIIMRAGAVGKILIKKVYTNKSSMGQWEPVIGKHSLTPVWVPNNTKGKNSVDITLVVDAMTLLYERPDLTGFCIVSSDADFTALAKHVQTKDKYVLGIGKAVTPESFRNACSDFVCLDEPTTPTTPVESISEAVLSPLIELPDSDFLDLAIKAYKQVSGAESRIGRVPARVLRESMLQLNQGYHPNAKLTVERLKKLAVSSPIIIQLHEETDGKTAIHWVRIYEDTPIDRLRRAYHFVIEDKRFTYEDGWVALAAIGEALQTLYPSVEPLEYKGVKQPKKVVQKLTQDYHEIVDLRYDAQQHPYVYFKN